MREIFLGKTWHWGLLLAVVALLAWAGSMKTHVIQFNSFLVTVVVISLAVIVLVLKTHKPGDRVTREPLMPDQNPQGEQVQEDAHP